MNRLKSSLTIISAALLCSTSPLLAQQKRVSPHDATTAQLDGATVSIFYGRPYSKDPKSGETRKIWGGVVPFGKVWRTGADEATLLVAQKPLMFGETLVPAGAYSLFTLPMEDGSAKLIVSKQLGEWGAYSYDEKQDLARIDLKKEATAAPLDQFTMMLDKTGVLSLAWENTKYSVSFTVKK